MSLVQLPPELLYHILAFFDAYDLIRIRQVSEQSAPSRIIKCSLALDMQSAKSIDG